MTPSIENHLSHRDERRADRAYQIIRAAHRVSGLVGKWTAKIVFNSASSHMRYIPPDLSMAVAGPGSWELSMNGSRITRTRPLLDLVDSIDRPVSIIASGPSALDYPWDRLRDGRRFVIAVNGSPTLLAESGIVPDLMVVIDDKFCLTGAAHFAAAAGVPLVIETIAGATWAALAPDDVKARDVTLLERVNSWHAIPMLTLPELARMNEQSGSPWSLPEKMDVKSRVGWSARPEWGFFSGRTVTFAALQVAVRLGARDIEIIGMDLEGTGRAYAEDAAQVRPSYLTIHYTDYILPSFEIMSRALAGTGVHVRNLSPVCPLPRHLFAP